VTDDLEDLDEAGRLQQYEIIWVLPHQRSLPGRADGFALEIVDFLGPGDIDERGQQTIWVRGPVLNADRRRGQIVAVAVPHDQPRAP
jgi:hypothetical protein